MGASVLQRVGWVLVAVVGLLTIPGLVVRPSVGIDPSWELGLHLARDHGFVVGRDIVFNYGPWGFLNQPLTLLVISAALNAVVMFLYSGLLLWLNLTTFRGALRPSPVRIGALLFSLTFFGYFSFLTLKDQLGL